MKRIQKGGGGKTRREKKVNRLKGRKVGSKVTLQVKKELKEIFFFVLYEETHTYITASH